MSANIDTMAYAGATPWHGLGTSVKEVMTSEEAIKAGGLNWEVEKKKIHFESKEKKEMIEFPGKFATVRTDKDVGLGIVGGQYTIMQNHEAFTFFDNIVTKKEAIYHTVGSLGKGQKIWLLAKLPKSIEVVHDDVVDQYLLLSNSHDGTSAVSVRFTPIRVVCQNTLVAAFNSSSYVVNVRHSSKMHGKVEEAQRILGISKEFYTHFEEMAKAMVKKPLTEDTLETLLKGIGYGKDKEDSTRSSNIRDTIMKYIETGKGNTSKRVKGTLWAGVNGIVEYVDYGRLTKDMGDGVVSNRLESVWFGGGATIKLKAWNTAVELLK